MLKRLPRPSLRDPLLLRDWREPRDLRRIWRDPPGWWPCQSSCCSSSSTSGCSCSMCLGSSSSLASGSSSNCTPAFTIDLTQIGNRDSACCSNPGGVAAGLADRQTACLKLLSSKPNCCVWSVEFCDLCSTPGGVFGGDHLYSAWVFSIFMCATPISCPPAPPENYGLLPSQSGGPWVFLEIMNTSGGCTNTMLYRIAASDFDCQGTNVFHKAPGNFGAINLCAWPDTLTAIAQGVSQSSCTQPCIPCAGPFSIDPTIPDFCMQCNGCAFESRNGTSALWFDASNQTWYLSIILNNGTGMNLYYCPAAQFNCTGTSHFTCLSGACALNGTGATTFYAPSCTSSGGGPPCCGITGGGSLLCEVDLTNLGPCICFHDQEVFRVDWNVNSFQGSLAPVCAGGAQEILVTLSCDPNAGGFPFTGVWTLDLQIIGGGVFCHANVSQQFDSSICDPLNMLFSFPLPCTGCPSNQTVTVTFTF